MKLLQEQRAALKLIKLNKLIVKILENVYILRGICTIGYVLRFVNFL